MNAVQSWVKTLPPSLQTLYYAIESALVVGAVLLLTSLYGALQTPTGLAGFDWRTQVHTAIIAAATGVVKALLDLLKGPPAPSAAVPSVAESLAVQGALTPPSSPGLVSPISSASPPTHRGLVTDPPAQMPEPPTAPPAQGA